MAAPLTLDVPALLSDYGDKLLRHLASHVQLNNAQTAAVDAFRRQYSAESERLAMRGVSASSRDLNQWIASLLSIVEQGGSRDELLACYLEELDQLRLAGKSDVIFALVIEQVDDGKQVLGYKLAHRCGDIHARHWANFASDLDRMGAASFLQALMQAESSLPLQLATTVPDYDGFLDSFARTALDEGENWVATRRSEVRDRYWLTGVSLVSQSADQARRALFQVYRNIGTTLIPNPGKGAGLEVRALDMLRIAYGLVDHQEAGLAADLNEQRKDMLLDLAPTIYSHDLMTPLTNINAFVELLARDMTRFGKAARKVPPDSAVLQHMIDAVTHVSHLSRDVRQLLRYLHAFASLEQTGMNRWALSRAMENVRELTRSNCDRLGISLEVSPLEGGDRELAMEPVYFVVVFMNLLMNAIHLIEKVPKARRHGRIQIRFLAEADTLMTWVANTDTEVEPRNRTHIFRRGFSTRGGSGRGLSICRRICTHVGGALDLLPPVDLAAAGLDAVFKVAFRFKVPLTPRARVTATVGKRVPTHSNKLGKKREEEL